MRISVNGEPIDLDAQESIADLLRRCGLDAAPCAVEINRELVPRREHDRRRLAPGDAVEIVTLVGGG
jgi:thiamine biosynthesis protein ThiS